MQMVNFTYVYFSLRQFREYLQFLITTCSKFITEKAYAFKFKTKVEIECYYSPGGKCSILNLSDPWKDIRGRNEWLWHLIDTIRGKDIPSDYGSSCVSSRYLCHEINSFFSEGMVTNPAIWLVLYLVSIYIFLSLLQRIGHCSTRKSTCRLPIYIYIYNMTQGFVPVCVCYVGYLWQTTFRTALRIVFNF